MGIGMGLKVLSRELSSGLPASGKVSAAIGNRTAQRLDARGMIQNSTNLVGEDKHSYFMVPARDVPSE